MSAETPAAMPSEAPASTAVASDRARSRARRAEDSSSGCDGGAAVAVGRERPAFGVREVMADELGLRLNQAAGSAIPEREQAAELVDDFVGVEADGAGVVADERPGENSRWPARKVVSFERLPQVPADLGDRGYGLDRDASPLALSAKTGAECIALGHEGL